MQLKLISFSSVELKCIFSDSEKINAERFLLGFSWKKNLLMFDEPSTAKYINKNCFAPFAHTLEITNSEAMGAIGKLSEKGKKDKI